MTNDVDEMSAASRGFRMVGSAPVERLCATKVTDVGESGLALASEERNAIVEVLECWRRSSAIQQQLPEWSVVSLCSLLWRTR